MKLAEPKPTELKTLILPAANAGCLPTRNRCLTDGVFETVAVDYLSERTSVVITSKVFRASPETVWKGLMFYEQIKKRPPFLLRLLLPIPVRTEGRKSEPGDEVKCIYESGHLVKRVTKVVPRQEYAFDVIDQRLAFGGGIKLLGGSYKLQETAKDTTQVFLETRHVSRNRPHFLCKHMESWICHSFHRHILSAIYQSIQHT